MRKEKIEKKLNDICAGYSLGVYAKEIDMLSENQFKRLMSELSDYQDFDLRFRLNGQIIYIEVSTSMIDAETFEVDFYYLTKEQYERYN